jgi:trehalose-6-phosphatase
VYFGDDLSDEPAFAAASRGVSVLVRSARPTRAHYTVAGTAQVVTWLRQMEAALDEAV